MITVEEKIDKIRDSWFIGDPIYFMAQSLFRITFSDSVLKIAAAPRHIYINRDFANSLSMKDLETVLKIELLRVLLRHPFTRFTHGCDNTIAYIASEMVISNILKIDGIDIIKHDSFFPLNGMKKLDHNSVGRARYSAYSFEEFYRLVSRAIKDENKDITTIKGDLLAANYDEIQSATKYWVDDMLSLSDVRRIIDHISSYDTQGVGKGIGSMSGSAIERIMADDPPFFDYVEPLRRFRHSVVCTNKRKTRTKPSRRYGYDQMGSTYEYNSNVLIICDTSGSMNENELSSFLGFLNGFLSSGLSSVDCVQFDNNIIDNTLEKFKRKVYNYTFSGRGGTNVTDIIDYVSNRSKKKYDGVIVYSDGFFFFEKEVWKEYLTNTKTKYVFCLTSEDAFDEHSKEMKGIPNIEFTYININDKWDR